MVVISGGGTGGHLYPALTLGDALLELRPDVRTVYVGARRGVEARVLPERGVEHVLLPVEGFRRDRPWRNGPALLALGRALGTVGGLFRRIRPELVVVTGGYAGGPAGIVAVLMGVPLVLQEQNSLPGITTRALARWARQVHVAYPEAVSRLPRRIRPRARVSGNPIRRPGTVDRAEARGRFGIDPVALLVLVVGGSQGSRALNRLVLEAVGEVEGGRGARPDSLELLWATGPTHHDAVSAALAGMGSPAWVHTLPYVDDMPAALSAADLAVSRAGAMTTSEFLAWGLPSVLVPLPTAAADHQTRNAEALAGAGAALHLPEAGATGATLWQAVTEVVSKPGRRGEMARAARERGRPGAAREIARDLAALLPPPPSDRGVSP